MSDYYPNENDKNAIRQARIADYQRRIFEAELMILEEGSAGNSVKVAQLELEISTLKSCIDAIMPG